MLVSQKAITLQLQQQLEGLRRQTTAPADTDVVPFMLLATVCTLIAMNLLGWFCFTHWRKSLRDPARSGSSIRGVSRRPHATLRCDDAAHIAVAPRAATCCSLLADAA